MLMSAIDSAGWGTTEDVFSPRCPPPPSSSHQFAPRSRGSHHALFAHCVWPVLQSVTHPTHFDCTSRVHRLFARLHVSTANREAT